LDSTRGRGLEVRDRSGASPSTVIMTSQFVLFE